jgi:hypothetical protein
MAANAFTLFGTLNIESRKFESALNKADKLLSDTGNKLTDFENKVKASGKAADSVKTQIDALTKAFKDLAGASTSVKSISVTLNAVGNAGNQAASATSKVGSAMKKATVDTSAFQQMLDRVEAELSQVQTAVGRYANQVTAAGKLTASSTRQIDKLQTTLRKQRDALTAAMDGYTKGSMSAKQFADAVARIASNIEKVSSKTQDYTAKLTDTIAKEKADAAAKQQARAAAEAKRQALEAARAATQREKAEAKAAAAASKQQAAGMREAAAAAKQKEAAMKRLGSQITQVGATTKGFGTDLTYLVSVPMVGLGAYAVKAATSFDALRNKLTAATGSVEQANRKLEHFLQLSRTAPGVFVDGAASLYAAFKPMGLTDNSIDEIVRAFGRLKTAEENFDFDQFRLNMQQMYTQFFEFQDLKQALTFFPQFSKLLTEQLGMTENDLQSLQEALKKLQEKGLLTFENFTLLIANSINKNKNFELLKETLGNKFIKLQKELEYYIAPFGRRIAELLLPAFEKIVAYTAYLTTTFLALSPATQQAILGFGFLIAASGVLVTVLGTVVGIIGVLTKGIVYLGGLLGGKAALTAGLAKFGSTLAGVFTVAGAKVIAIVGVIIAIIYALYKAVESNFGNINKYIGDFADKISSSFSNAGQGISDFWGSLVDAFEVFKKSMSMLFSYLEPLFKGLWSTISQTLIGVVEIIESGIKAVWQVVSSFILMIIKLASGDLTGALYELLNVFIGVMNGIIGVVGGAMRQILAPIIGVIDAVSSYLPAGMRQGVESVKKGLTNILDGMNEGIPLFHRAGWTAGQAYGQGLAMGMPSGDGKGEKSDFDKALEEMKKFLAGFKGGGGGGAARGAGKSAAQDFFEGLIEGINMLKRSANAELAKFFDIGQLRAGLKGKSGQAVVDFIKPIVDEMAKLPDTATYLDQFNQRFGELAKNADPKMKVAFDAVIAFLKEAQTAKDASENIKKTADELKRIQDWVTGIEKDLKPEQSLSQQLEKMLAGPEGKGIDEAAKSLLRLRIATAEAAKAQKAATEANKEFNQSYMQGLAGLREFININAEQATNLERLQIYLWENALAGKIFSQEMVNAAIAAAKQADAAVLQEKNLARVKDRLSSLGIELRNTKSPIEQLNETLKDTTGLQALAKELDIPIEKLKQLIIEAHNAKAAIADLVSPKMENGEAQKASPLEGILIGIQNRIKTMKDELPSLSEGIVNVFAMAVEGVGDIFANAVREWDGTWKGFWKSLKTGFAQLVREIAAYMVKLLVMQALMSALGGMFGAKGKGAAGAAGSPIDISTMGMTSFAGSWRGGLITGPGSGTSDSIPTLLSNGEYVIPSKAVRKFGVRFFDQLRNMEMPSQLASNGAGAMMPSVASVSNNSNVSNTSNTFNINVPPGTPGQKTGSMIQKDIIMALKKTERRNR